MSTSVFVKIANLDDFSLEKVMNSSLLSPEIIESAEQFNSKRQKQYIVCRYLLAKLLNKHCKIPKLPLITIGENGRPTFSDQALPDFNISHSGSFIAVAMSPIGRIGLDIEAKRPRINHLKVAEQFFSSSEYSWLVSQSDPLEAFWQLWTLREATLKLYGKGVWQMKEIEITMPCADITASFGEHINSYHIQTNALYLSICSDKKLNHVLING